MRSHTIVTQIFLAVKAVGCGWVFLITRAALWLTKVVQQAPVWVRKARGTSTQPAVVLSILVLNLLLRAHHYVEQVAEEEVGGGQGVHAGLRDGHLLVTGGAAQL